MSSTTTNTETSSKTPEITVLNRICSFPLVASSIGKVDVTLSSNPYTRSPYCTAKGFSDAAFKFSVPLQVQLAPFILRADKYANKAVDFVEVLSPFPMKATPKEVCDWVRETQQSYANYASRTIDERVRNPALHVALVIDKSFAPILDVFEGAAHRLGSHPNSLSSKSNNDSQSQYQYQRALFLSKALRDEVQLYSNQQFKDLQNHSTLVHRSIDTAKTIVSAANSRVQALSDNMIAQIHNLRCQLQELAGSLQSSTAAVYNNSSQQIPELQKSLQGLSSQLHEIMIAKDVTIQEKAARVGNQVRERVAPLLETMRVNITEFLEARSKDQAPVDKPLQNGH